MVAACSVLFNPELSGNRTVRVLLLRPLLTSFFSLTSTSVSVRQFLAKRRTLQTTGSRGLAPVSTPKVTGLPGNALWGQLGPPQSCHAV